MKLDNATRLKVFGEQLRQAKIPAPTAEFRFHPARKWRADFAWVSARLLLEVEGGVWTGGRHVSGSGFTKDMEKYNAATLLGYRILRVTPKQLTEPETIELIREALDAAA